MFTFQTLGVVVMSQSEDLFTKYCIVVLAVPPLSVIVVGPEAPIDVSRWIVSAYAAVENSASAAATAAAATERQRGAVRRDEVRERKNIENPQG
jgi:hypothetical protein